MATKRSWREKLLDNKGLPKVGVVPAGMVRRGCSGTFVVPAPVEVDELMGRVGRGKVTTIDAIRAKLARRHKTDSCCPMTTGIFAWIAAHAADEAEREGKKQVTPYWRTLKSGGELNPKYPGGVANLSRRLKAEGHRVVREGKRYFVAHYQRRA